MGAPTAKLETVVIVSPIKVLSLFSNLVSMLCILCVVLSTFWFHEDKNTRYGLWFKCDIINGTEAELTDNQLLNDSHLVCELFNKVWIQLCGALVVVAAVCSVFGVALLLLGFSHKKRQDRKMKFYRSALFVHFVGFLSLALALTIFPVYFTADLQDKSDDKWYFGWSYGVAWGAAIFLFGAAILLICDRNKEEVSYKERLYLNQEDEENVETQK